MIVTRLSAVFLVMLATAAVALPNFQHTCTSSVACSREADHALDLSRMEITADFLNPFPSSMFGVRTRPENNAMDYLVEASELRQRAYSLRQQEQYIAGTPAYMESQAAIAGDQFYRMSQQNKGKFPGL